METCEIFTRQHIILNVLLLILAYYKILTSTMTNFKFLPILFLFTGLLLLTSCGSDVDCEDPNTFTEFTSISEALVDLTFDFNADPTDPETCNQLIDLINDLIDEGENIQDCVPAADRAEFNEFLQASEDNRDLLTCG